MDHVEHRAKAKNNRQFAKELLAGYPALADWAVTAIFYAALHHVDARLAQAAGRHPKSHTERKLLVRQHAGAIYEKFRLLYERSREARYDMVDLSHVSKATLREYAGWVDKYFQVL